MPFTRLALAAGCALAFAGPALAQSAGYDAVFGGGSSGSGGGGYSEVFGASGSRSGLQSSYVSPLFSEATEPRRRFVLGGADPSEQGRPMSIFARQKASGVVQQDNFMDSFGDTMHTAGSTDFMSGIGVVAGYNGGALDVDPTRGGLGYGGERGVHAFTEGLGGRDVNDSFIDPQTGQWTPLQADRQAKYRARAFGQIDQGGAISFLGRALSPGAPDGYSATTGGGAGDPGYDMVFGAGAAQAGAADYVDPLSANSASSASANGAVGSAYGAYGGAAGATYGGAANGTYGGAASAGYGGGATAAYGAANGSLGATDYQDPLMPGGAYGGPAAPARTPGLTAATSAHGASGADSPGAGSGSGDLLSTYGVGGLSDPLRDYRMK